MRLAVGDVGLDLLERAAGEERRGGADERDQPAVGQAGADADEVLLGDADVDQPVGELLAEADEVARADGVVADGDDARVLARPARSAPRRRPRGSRRSGGVAGRAPAVMRPAPRARLDLVGGGHLVVPLDAVLHERHALALDRCGR